MFKIKILFKALSNNILITLITINAIFDDYFKQLLSQQQPKQNNGAFISILDIV
ncbi:MAG: hypothetical protein M0P92_02395 [Acholeplasmataceae bacterium]|nr:hypothetical protein [Acholeplasmataceae bacterium]MCK9427518.1 hypothetical protein [Acholeplasmataceae bacterium]HHT39201.1 hypothetical protein [Acholeplasmataceae bacterium]